MGCNYPDCTRGLCVEPKLGWMWMWQIRNVEMFFDYKDWWGDADYLPLPGRGEGSARHGKRTREGCSQTIIVHALNPKSMYVFSCRCMCSLVGVCLRGHLPALSARSRRGPARPSPSRVARHRRHPPGGGNDSRRGPFEAPCSPEDSRGVRALAALREASSSSSSSSSSSV